MVGSCLHTKDEKKTDEGVSTLQDALSDAVSKRQDLHHEYIQEKQSRERAERECIELRVANEELGTKLGVEGGQDGSVATLKEKMEKLVKENHELREEIEARVQEVKNLYCVLKCTLDIDHTSNNRG